MAPISHDWPGKTLWREDSKCYTIAAEQIGFGGENFASCCEKWSVFCYLCGHRYVMIRNISYKIEVSPLIILHFPLLAPKKFLDAQIFNLRFSDPSEMTQIADKLRWYRYRQALLQSEVADRIGIDQKTYMRYEEYGRDYYPIEHMQKLAGMYDVPVESLLDDYSLFLYKGQGKQVLEARKKLKMTQKEFADRLGVQLSALKKWEQDRVKMQKATWEKYFR